MAKANRPGASAGDVARGNKVAALTGVDLRTGRPLETKGRTGGMTDFQAASLELRETEIANKVQEGVDKKQAAFEVDKEQSTSEIGFFSQEIDKMTDVRDQIAGVTGNNFFTEGGAGWLSAILPFDTDAAKVERLATEIAGNTFIRGIVESKNRGATFGPLSDLEGEKITAAYGRLLKTNMGNEDRILAINSVLESLNGRFEAAKTKHNKKYGEPTSQGGEAGSSPAPTQGNVPSIEGFTVNRVN
jgi:hypothetical protein